MPINGGGTKRESVRITAEAQLKPIPKPARTEVTSEVMEKELQQVLIVAGMDALLRLP